MNLPNDYEVEGQLSIFDVFSPDIWSGKTYQEHSVQTGEKISDASLKKQQGSLTRKPLFLDLRTERSGLIQVAFWQMGGQLLGEYMTHSFGEFPKEEKESRLSQILEDHPHLKYCLSPRACQGILSRSERKGKELPPLLKKTLLKQSAFKNEPDVRGGARESSYNTREQEHCQQSTINQCCNSSGNDVSGTLDSSYYEGCGERQGTEREVVCVGNGQMAQAKESDVVGALNCMHEQQAIITYGIDRASFNQGLNAQYDFSVDEEMAQTLVAKGPGGGIKQTVGALCASDFKGVGNQYVSDGKCIIQSVGQSSNGQSNADKRR